MQSTMRVEALMGQVILHENEGFGTGVSIEEHYWPDAITTLQN